MFDTISLNTPETGSTKKFNGRSIFASDENDIRQSLSDDGEAGDDQADLENFLRETREIGNIDQIYSDLAQNESFLDPETGMVRTGKIKMEIWLSKTFYLYYSICYFYNEFLMDERTIINNPLKLVKQI